MPLPQFDDKLGEQGMPAEPTIVGQENYGFEYESSAASRPRLPHRSSSSSSSESRSGRPHDRNDFEHLLFDDDGSTPALIDDETPFTGHYSAIPGFDSSAANLEPLFPSSAATGLQPPVAFANAFTTSPFNEPGPSSLRQPPTTGATCSPKELFDDHGSPPFGVEPLSLSSPPACNSTHLAQSAVDGDLPPEAEGDAEEDNDASYTEASTTCQPKKTQKSRAPKRKRAATEDAEPTTGKFTGTRKGNTPLVDMDAPIASR